MSAVLQCVCAQTSRLIRLLGISLLLLAGGILTLTFSPLSWENSQLEEIRGGPSAVQLFRAQSSGTGARSVKMSPLIVEAQVFARYLDPPKSPDRPSTPVRTASSAPPVSLIRPVALSVKFRLRGTSYYPNEPGRSMALIAELGAAEGSERWVKEGAQLGHLVIHEIRRGAIVYHDGESLREMAVERSASLPSLVRDLRPGSLKVSAAMDGGGPILPAPSGPNGVETAGGD